MVRISNIILVEVEGIDGFVLILILCRKHSAFFFFFLITDYVVSCGLFIYNFCLVEEVPSLSSMSNIFFIIMCCLWLNALISCDFFS